jgi:hypothetical protein
VAVSVPPTSIVNVETLAGSAVYDALTRVITWSPDGSMPAFIKAVAGGVYVVARSGGYRHRDGGDVRHEAALLAAVGLAKEEAAGCLPGGFGTALDGGQPSSAGTDCSGTGLAAVTCSDAAWTFGAMAAM